jgi:hypothetical protein
LKAGQALPQVGGALIQDQHPECSSPSHSGEVERGGEPEQTKSWLTAKPSGVR